MDIWKVIFEIHIEKHVGFHINGSLKLADVIRFEISWQFFMNFILGIMKIPAAVLKFHVCKQMGWLSKLNSHSIKSKCA
jgi:hypothetical protein